MFKLIGKKIFIIFRQKIFVYLNLWNMLMPSYSLCAICVLVALPLGAIGWSLICDSGIFWSYLLVFFCFFAMAMVQPKTMIQYLTYGQV